MNQRILTKIAVIVFAWVLLMPISTLAQEHKYKGEKSVGVRAGFSSSNTTGTAGLYFSYRFSKYFRLSPKIDFAFQHYGTDSFSYNLDTEYPVALGNSGKVNFYPIAGINYSTFNTHSVLDDVDSSERINKFGLNLGAGLESFVTPTLRLAMECKCQLISHYTGAWITVSIGYKF